ncbi:MAG: Npt1/Npt2 family nucleotide transporter, partial [Gemmatimonadota bacterium]
MSVLRRAAAWLDIRPNEVRTVAVAFGGAFLVLSFLILARSVREALYLSRFPVETLPYVTGASVLLTLPAVGIFIRLLSRASPRAAYQSLVLLLGVALTALWLLLPGSEAATVAFYLITNSGAVLLASGFWVIVSELFAVRDAKRLFGLISAGGTLGAMTSGLSTGRLTTWLGGSIPLVGVLLFVLALLAVLQTLLPRSLHVSPEKSEQMSGLGTAMATIRATPHLQLIALVVFAATFATTLLDYQFKEFAQSSMLSAEQLAGFFGSFYGWAGGVALVLQLLVTGRALESLGVGRSLSVLPAFLFLGALGLLMAPGLLLATSVRGGDYALRKSLYRSVTEFLYVPIPAQLRRRSKTFIDSVVDGAGEGAGALVIFLLITAGGQSSRLLAVGILLAAGLLLYLARRSHFEYFSTIQARLKSSGAHLEHSHQIPGRDLLSATFTQLDITRMLASDRLSADSYSPPTSEASEAAVVDLTPDDILASGNPGEIAKALVERDDWTPAQAPALARWLARDRMFELVASAILSLGEEAVPALADLVGDEAADFVVRRRIPRVLARMPGRAADEALLRTLRAGRFEIRYWAAVALVRRQGEQAVRGEKWPEDWRDYVWTAIRTEVGRERPVWELQRLLDDSGEFGDEFVQERLGRRGELSLEHAFRLLSLVLDPVAVRSAYHGIRFDHPELRSFALEYLEQVLPDDVQARLWPFIGDAGERQLRRTERPIDAVVADLMKSGATLFGGEAEQAALRRLLGEELDDSLGEQ